MAKKIIRSRWPHPKPNSLEYYKTLYRLEFTNQTVLHFSEEENRVLDLGLLYQKIRRERVSHPFYRAFSPTSSGGKPFDPRKTSNWKHFSRACEVIEENDFKTVPFLFAQFEELKDFYAQSFPKPSMIASDGAVDRMTNWILKNKKKKLEAVPVLEDEKSRKKLEQVLYALRKAMKGNHFSAEEVLTAYPIMLGGFEKKFLVRALGNQK